MKRQAEFKAGLEAAIIAHPDWAPSRIAKLLGCAPKTARKHFDRMIAEGRIVEPDWLLGSDNLWRRRGRVPVLDMPEPPVEVVPVVFASAEASRQLTVMGQDLEPLTDEERPEWWVLNRDCRTAEARNTFKGCLRNICGWRGGNGPDYDEWPWYKIRDLILIEKIVGYIADAGEEGMVGARGQLAGSSRVHHWEALKKTLARSNMLWAQVVARRGSCDERYLPDGVWSRVRDMRFNVELAPYKQSRLVSNDDWQRVLNAINWEAENALQTLAWLALIYPGGRRARDISGLRSVNVAEQTLTLQGAKQRGRPVDQVMCLDDFPGILAIVDAWLKLADGRGTWFECGKDGSILWDKPWPFRSADCAGAIKDKLKALGFRAGVPEFSSKCGRTAHETYALAGNVGERMIDLQIGHQPEGAGRKSYNVEQLPPRRGAYRYADTLLEFDQVLEVAFRRHIYPSSARTLFLADALSTGEVTAVSRKSHLRRRVCVVCGTPAPLNAKSNWRACSSRCRKRLQRMSDEERNRTLGIVPEQPVPPSVEKCDSPVGGPDAPVL